MNTTGRLNLFIRVSALLVIFLLLISTSGATYFDSMPLHHQTSYSTLLRRMRANSMGFAMPSRSTPSIAPGQRTKSSPTTRPCMLAASRQQCRDTCQRMREYCTSTCYSVATPCTRSEGKKKMNQLQCISGCLNPNAAVYGTPDNYPFKVGKADRPSPQRQNDAPDSDRTRDNSRINAPLHVESNLEELTPAEKCRRDGFANSAVCEFEYSSPQEALRVFNTIRPSLSLCDHDKSPEEKRQINRVHRVDPSQQLIQHNNTRRPSESATSSTNARKSDFLPRQRRSPKFFHRQKRQSRNTSNRPNVEIEVCPTKLEVTQPLRAKHAKSGDVVSLYFYRGPNRPRGSQLYAQKFEVGGCLHSRPIVDVRVSGSTTPTCRRSMSQHLADFYVNPSLVDMTLYKRCQTINDTLTMCRDWVYLPSHCKLYTSPDLG